MYKTVEAIDSYESRAGSVPEQITFQLTSRGSGHITNVNSDRE